MEKDFPRMEIDLGHSGDRETFSFEESLDVPGPEEDLAGRLEVEVRSTRAGSRYLLEGDVGFSLRVGCDRCLEEYDFRLETAFSLIARKGGRNGVPEGIEGEDYVILGDAEEYGFDIFPFVREAVFLDLPIRYLCGEQCRGICPVCGRNLNEGTCSCSEEKRDSRWSPLGKLLNDEKKD